MASAGRAHRLRSDASSASRRRRTPSGSASDKRALFERGIKGTPRAHRRPSSLVCLDQSRREAPSALAGRSVGLLAGVARPGSVRRSLEALGATIVAERLFPDHHDYSATDCASLDPSVPEWVTTEKDALKILPEWMAGKKLLVLGIEIDFEEEATALDAIEKALFENRLLSGFER